MAVRCIFFPLKRVLFLSDKRALKSPAYLKMKRQTGKCSFGALHRAVNYVKTSPPLKTLTEAAVDLLCCCR